MRPGSGGARVFLKLERLERVELVIYLPPAGWGLLDGQQIKIFLELTQPSLHELISCMLQLTNNDQFTDSINFFLSERKPGCFLKGAFSSEYTEELEQNHNLLINL